MFCVRLTCFVVNFYRLPKLLAAVKFIAHLVNRKVVRELVALELLTLLLDKPTDDSVEVAVGFVTECGSILQDLCPEACMVSFGLQLVVSNAV